MQWVLLDPIGVFGLPFLPYLSRKSKWRGKADSLLLVVDPKRSSKQVLHGTRCSLGAAERHCRPLTIPLFSLDSRTGLNANLAGLLLAQVDFIRGLQASSPSLL